MQLLIDTQVLVWLLTSDRRLRRRWVEALGRPDVTAGVSAVTAWEFADLQHRGRLAVSEDIADLQSLFGLELQPFPDDCWTLAARLPDIHRDPVDRMLVAQAIHSGMTLMTADERIRDYPVDILW